MRIPFIAANWKMYKTVHEAVAFAKEFRVMVKDVTDVEIVLAPPFTALHAVADAARNSNIGVAGQNVPIPRRVVRFYQLPVETGVLLVSFETNGEASAAREAGMQAGDLMVEFDGLPIRGIDDLHRLLTDERIGKRVPVTVIRGVQKLTVELVPKEKQ